MLSLDFLYLNGLHVNQLIMKNSQSMLFVLRFVTLFFLIIVMLSSCKKNAKGDFTENDILRIHKTLESLDVDEYRVVLPVFENGKVVDSKVYGNLPITEIRQVAVSKGISYSETGNLQAVFQNCRGGGAGSHVNSDSGAKGVDDRLDQILKNIDKSKFVQIRK